MLQKYKIKHILLTFWIVLTAVSLYKLFSSGIPLNEYPSTIAKTVSAYGIWAPVIFIALFAIRPLIFFPATLLSLSAGALFGPFQAVLILIIAENLSSLVSYTVGKYFGADIVKIFDKKETFIAKFEDYIQDNGFVSILMLRLLYAPFDLVGYFAGASSISYKSFAFATLIGILPGLITSAFLGGSVYNPANLIISASFFIVGLVISKFIKKNKSYVKIYN